LGTAAASTLADAWDFAGLESTGCWPRFIAEKADEKVNKVVIRKRDGVAMTGFDRTELPEWILLLLELFGFDFLPRFEACQLVVREFVFLVLVPRE
jgi:hypothetical protein